MTTKTNDPIVIGFEQVLEALKALGITDATDIHEVRIGMGEVEVLRVVRGEMGDALYKFDSFGLETTSSKIPVVYDDEAAEKLRSASTDLLDSVLPDEEGY